MIEKGKRERNRMKEDWKGRTASSEKIERKERYGKLKEEKNTSSCYSGKFSEVNRACAR